MHADLEAQLPCSDEQWALIEAHRFSAAGARSYNLVFSLSGSTAALAPARVRRALAALCRRHHLLRARLAEQGRHWDIAPAARFDPPLNCHSIDDEAARAARSAAIEDELLETSIDLHRRPWRAVLISGAGGEAMLWIAVHHAIADGWSLALISEELGQLCAAESAAKTLPPAADFGQYLAACRARAAAAPAALHWWCEQYRDFAGAPPLPTDRPRGPAPHYDCFTLEQRLSPALSARLRQLATACRCGLSTVLLAALKVNLYRSSGQADISVALPLAGQALEDMHELVGCCVAVLPTRTVIDPGAGFITTAAALGAHIGAAIEHRQVTVEQLQRALSAPGEQHRPTLCNVMFSYDWALNAPAAAGAEPLRAAYRQPRANFFERVVNVYDEGDCLRLSWADNSALYTPDNSRHRLLSFVELLAQIAAAPHCPVSELSLQSGADRALLARLNDTASTPPATQVIAWWQRTLERHADSEQPAVIAGGRSLDRAALDDWAGRVAAALIARGVAPGERVGLCLGRDVALAAALLGAARAGAAWVPLDPQLPAERLAMLIERAELRQVLSLSADHPVALPRGCDWLDVDQLADQRPQREAARLRPEQAAYALFTSGSTGLPKAVSVGHRQLVNLLHGMAQAIDPPPQPRWLAVTTISFDISILECWLPLLLGGTLVLADEETVRDGAALAALIEEQRIDILQATPASWRLLLAEPDFQAPQLIGLIGGEAVPSALARELAPRLKSLWNCYGPTETTIWSTVQRLTADAEAVAIGRPIANTQVLVVDEQGCPAPVGQPGELLIGGDGVAQGYQGDPERTAAAFIPAPPLPGFGPGPLFRTRDRVCLQADGSLRYIERMDNQIKLRGYRIAPGEIEACLCAHPSIAAAAVALRGEDDERALHAWLLLRPGATLDPVSLSAHLARQLPPYMVPCALHPAAALPLSASGKIDRRALAVPADWARAQERPAAPLSPAQRGIAEQWAALLGGALAISPQSNFFRLGGHSLLATRFVRWAQQTHGVRLPIQSLLLEDLAAITAALGLDAAAPASAPRRRRFHCQLLSLGDGGQLYCCAALPADNGGRAVLIVAPPGLEGRRLQVAIAGLMDALAERGIAAMRFDWRGEGNASGDTEALDDLQPWFDDLRTAQRHLAARSGAQPVLLGLRLGALIAAASGAAPSGRLLCWQAPPDGARWLAEMRALEHRLRRDGSRFLYPIGADQGPDSELAGGRWRRTWLTAVEALPGAAGAARSGDPNWWGEQWRCTRQLGTHARLDEGLERELAAFVERAGTRPRAITTGGAST